MSDNSTRTACRDFERGDCFRGDKCKFYHPDGRRKVAICKDFQNKGCERTKCKFLHLSREEETRYNMTGELPEHGGAVQHCGSMPPKKPCKDFMNGRCVRGEYCRFAHVEEAPRDTMIVVRDDVTGGVTHAAITGELYGKRPRSDEEADARLVAENASLRRSIADLETEVSRITKMNDTLREQNTRYHAQLTRHHHAASQVVACYP